MRANPYADFVKVLAEVARHPSRSYYVYKSIILHNLFGVDIMAEAVEICKLRLFLKLVSQVDAGRELEPLPDIDFNIRAGNTLVGFATEAQFDATDTLASDKAQRQDIKASIADLADAFDFFRTQQTVHGGQVTSQDKHDLHKKLEGLSLALDKYLAVEYGIDPGTPDRHSREVPSRHSREGGNPAFNAWRASHQPFHWFAEFYGVMQEGGFDVVIGNPPYVEYSNIKSYYDIHGFETKNCGNLYAFVMERSLWLLSKNGYFGMIVPVSIGSTPRMESLRSCLNKKSVAIYYSSFADRPSCLFLGVHQILSICLLKMGSGPKSGLVSAGFHHWLGKERSSLFEIISYVGSQNCLVDSRWGKFSTGLELSIHKKIFNNHAGLASYFVREGHLVTVSGGTGGYWLRAFNKEQQSDEYKKNYVTNENNQLIFCSVINSTTFYHLWRIWSDCRHLTKRDIGLFRLDLGQTIISDLPSLGDLHIESLNKTKEVRIGRMTYEQYRPSLTKTWIDKIDRVLAHHYGLTDDELDFIINYDIKYRMGGTDEE